MTERFENPPLHEIRTLLQGIRTIAVVGLSPNPNRPSHLVAEALQRFGYRILPIRPAIAEILGEPAYPDLRQVQERIDLVDVFRAPEHVDEVVDACIERKVPALWLQDGVVNEAAALRARQADMFVVMSRCIYRDYLQLMR